MAESNEFLRKRPRKHSRDIVYDLTNLIIPIILSVIGLFASSQYFAKCVGYNPRYCGPAVFVTARHFLFIPKGYPVFNPGEIYLSIAAGLLDTNVQSNVLPTLFIFLLFVGVAVAVYMVLSIVRGKFYNKDSNMYGTARWATEKDIRKFGLMQTHGVVLAQLYKAAVSYEINPENASISLHLKKNAPLICHSGGTNTLLLAPTRSGKGVGSVNPTALSYDGHMIILDPKGEIYSATAGYARKFAHVLKFSPVSEETVHFNPLEEMHLNKTLGSEIDLVSSIIFERGQSKDNSNDFWDNNAQLLFNACIYHVLTSGLYKDDQKNISSIVQIIKLASAEKTKDEDTGEESDSGGEKLLDEMINSPHYDENGIHQEYMDAYVKSGAAQTKGMNPKVRSDVYSTLFSKVTLFTDAFIAQVTSHSDFKLDDFYDSKEPIRLYLTVPYGQMQRVMPVFKIIINYILNKFSSGELRFGEKEKRLSHRMLFLLDEFPALGKQQQIMANLGVLAGYKINFYIICQSIKQLDDIYGKDNTFLANCKTVMIYAPGEPDEAEKWSKMIGKESFTNSTMSTSGSRYSAALNNLSVQSQEIQRELINPDELQKLPPDQCIIMNQGMPPYIAKKNVYYEDPRFMYIAYGDHPVKFPVVHELKAPISFDIFGIKAGDVLLRFTDPFITEKRLPGWPAPYDIKDIMAECRSLPSQIGRKEKKCFVAPQVQKSQEDAEEKSETDNGTDPEAENDESPSSEMFSGGSDSPDGRFGGGALYPREEEEHMMPPYGGRMRRRGSLYGGENISSCYGTLQDEDDYGIPDGTYDNLDPPPTTTQYDPNNFSAVADSFEAEKYRKETADTAF